MITKKRLQELIDSGQKVYVYNGSSYYAFQLDKEKCNITADGRLERAIPLGINGITMDTHFYFYDRKYLYDTQRKAKMSCKKMPRDLVVPKFENFMTDYYGNIIFKKEK